MKQGLSSHASRAMKDRAEGGHCWGPGKEVSEGKNISKWLTDNSSNIMEKVAAFQP